MINSKHGTNRTIEQVKKKITTIKSEVNNKRIYTVVSTF